MPASRHSTHNSLAEDKLDKPLPPTPLDGLYGVSATQMSETTETAEPKFPLIHDPGLLITTRSVPASRNSSPKRHRRWLSRDSSVSSFGELTDRPESVFELGKSLFSRRKRSQDTSRGRSSSNVSSLISSLPESPGSARERYYGSVGSNKSSKRGTILTSSVAESPAKPTISSPFAFQHVTHTKPQQLPDVHRTSTIQLTNDFSALRASQAPTQNLKGIEVRNIYAGGYVPGSPAEPVTPPRTQTIPRKMMGSPPQSPIRDHSSISGVQSQANPGAGQPPMAPRMASILWDAFDPAILQPSGPDLTTGSRRPKAFHLPSPISTNISRSHSIEDLATQSAPTTPARCRTSATLESWPLAPLAEEDEIARRLSKESSRSARVSQSVADLSAKLLERLLSEQEQQLKGETPVAIPARSALRPQPAQQAVETSHDIAAIGVAYSPLQKRISLAPGFEEAANWEDDIDYCYENAAEADCDYDWDCPVDMLRVADSPLDPLACSAPPKPDATAGNGQQHDSSVPAAQPISQAYFDVLQHLRDVDQGIPEDLSSDEEDERPANTTRSSASDWHASHFSRSARSSAGTADTILSHSVCSPRDIDKAPGGSSNCFERVAGPSACFDTMPTSAGVVGLGISMGTPPALETVPIMLDLEAGSRAHGRKGSALSARADGAHAHDTHADGTHGHRRARSAAMARKRSYGLFPPCD
jgi:hypothetical protein